MTDQQCAQVVNALQDIASELANLNWKLSRLTGEDVNHREFIRTGDFVAAMMTEQSDAVR